MSFRLAIRVPRRPTGSAAAASDLALLSNALPALAVREAGAWRLEPYFPLGEAWVYPTADWRVRLRAPRGVEVAAPGVSVGGGVRHLANGRDYSFAAGRGLRRDARHRRRHRVSVWGAAQHPARPARHRAAPRPPAPAQPRALYGPYGWPDLQIVLTRVAAMEHTALIMAAEENFVLAHELAHMWWYALIGSDQARSPWLDEGFASYSERRARPQRAGRATRPSSSSRLLSRGVDYWDAHRARTSPSTSRAPACSSCSTAGSADARFRAALKAYALAHRYGWHTAAAFMAAMDAAAGAPGALDDLWFDFGLSTR